MKVREYIGQLEEELVKYQYNLDIFDRLYLVDKLFMLTETINREHVNRLGYLSMIHSVFRIEASEEALERISGDDDGKPWINYYVTIPALLTGLNDNVLREVTVRHSGQLYHLNYIIPEEFDTKEDNEWTSITKSFGVVDDVTIKIGRFSHSFMIHTLPLQAHDSITIRGIFKDQRDLLPSGYSMEDVLNIDLKVASTYRLMILFKKDVFTTIGLGQEKEDDSGDNQEQEVRE